MQSFRERSGFQGNQHCYQQEPHELSRLENYRHHHSQSGQGYEAHTLPTAGMPTAGAGSKDCYGQQTYPSYASSSAQTKKAYRGGKSAPSQHLQPGYSGHMSSGYSAQFMSEGHLQQKWDESTRMPHYEPDMVGHLEPRASGSSQYLEQNLLGISQSQCHLSSQPSAPVYTSPHSQGRPPNPTPPSLMYPQSHVHFPQHSRPPTSASSTYIEKCNSVPHGFKGGYGIPANTQYSRQLTNSTLKQNAYRQQNNYGYQQPPLRSGFEQQTSMQGMQGTAESVPKFQHYNHNQQNYCITDISVRSPEQYYQNCSPSSNHSPARSVGRSPSYSSTPSPLMPNPETFQYGQPVNATTSSSSASHQDQNLLMPPNTHQLPAVNHQSQSYPNSMRDRFSEKLFSNPSLWSLNALTSQVENISNNVQQLLLSEALMANKKGGKRNPSKKGEDYRGQFKALDDTSCSENQHGSLPGDPYSIPRSMPADLLEGGYSSSTEDQTERNYYYFGQGKVPTQASAHSQLSLDTVSTCSANSTDDMSVRSGDSDRSLQSIASEDNMGCDAKLQRMAFVEEQNSSLRSNCEEKSPISVTGQSPMKQESNSPLDIKYSGGTPKENFEESAWTDKMADEREIGQGNTPAEHECKGELIETTERQQEQLEDKKSPSFLHKINKTLSDETYSYETADAIYEKLENKYEAKEEDFSEIGFKLPNVCSEEKEDSEIKSEILQSELQPNAVASLPSSPRDASESNPYLTEKEVKSDTSHLLSQRDPLEPLTLTSKRHTDFSKEQHPVSISVHELRQRESLMLTEEVYNKGILEHSLTETLTRTGDNMDVAETSSQDMTYRICERRQVTCDITSQCQSIKTTMSTPSEKTTHLTQTRDHSDAKVLEPDSPQLPGKSVMHSAPSWADTPPSPQKGEEDIEPGISCPSAVTPSTKPEPVAPSAHPRLLGRKHSRGRRRLINPNPAIRRQLSLEGDGAPLSPQKANMATSGSLFSDQMTGVPPDISSQTPKLADGLPSRMCTRSLGSHNSAKICFQERRKPGLSSKVEPKPNPKAGQKPGTKSNPKPGSKTDLSPKPKPSSKTITKSGLKRGSKAGPKQNPKSESSPGPRSVSQNPVSKPGPKPNIKPVEGLTPKGPGRPKGKSVKYKDSVHDLTSCPGKHNENQDLASITVETVVDATVCSSIDSTVGTTLNTDLDASYVNAVAKDQKPMVLRSRKQTQRKLIDNKERDKLTDTSIKKLKETEEQEQMASQSSENTMPCQQSEDHSAVLIKRKAVFHSPDPIKKKKGCTMNRSKTGGPQLQELQNTLVGARGSKGRPKRGHELEQSTGSIPTKDNLLPEDINEPLSGPPQCPTKTKYLPPRKGRGLKYEAMVQKITSPASKKQLQTVQADSGLEETTNRSALELQGTEKRKTVHPTMLESEEGDITVRSEETADTAGIQTPRKKRRKWATVESTETSEIVFETGSLIINTPRLAKQKAIKNNHEMHLKQRKKKKKSEETGPNIENHERTLAATLGPTTTSTDSPAAAASSLPVTDLTTPAEDLPMEKSPKDTKPKRGRRPALKKKPREILGQGTAKGGQTVKKKTGPKRKSQQSTGIKVIINTSQGPQLRKKCKKVPTVKGKLSELLPEQESGNKVAFKPYVHIDSSRKLPFLCTIVNRVQEEQLLIQARKKSSAKIKDQRTLSKAISNLSVMLQGPLVNKSIADKCLLCCLCGRPANYRELGDLCGPYYPENKIPRKRVTVTYQEKFRQPGDGEREGAASGEAELPDVGKIEDKDSREEGTAGGECRPGTKEKRAQVRTRLGLCVRLKRLQMLRGRAGETVFSAGGEGCCSALQRLQLEAEVNECWAHESCVIWTTGVILIAGKLYGLKEAARESELTKCCKCQSERASVCCSWTNCTQKFHYVCAKETGCLFDEETFSIKCPEHQVM